MKYVACRRFRGKDLNGVSVNIPYGSELNTNGKYICLGHVPVCFEKSQTAHKYFAINEDGKGLERGTLTFLLAFMPRKTKCGFRYTDKERAMLINNWGKYIRQDVDMFLFNHEFFCAPVEDLKAMANSIKMIPEE